FFAQAVGRFVRSRKRGETASVFLPSVPKLMELANEMEEERDHALELDTAVSVEDLEDAPEEDLMQEANQEESASSSLTGAKFQALESQALFDKVLYDGGEFGTGGAIGSEEELDFLGIPGLLDADQVSTLLKQRQAEQLKRQPRSTPTEDTNVVDHRQMKELRKKLSASVSAWSARSGTPHGVIHNKLQIGSEEELDFLGIPGLLDADQVSTLLKQRQAEQLKRQPRSTPTEDTNVVDHRQMKELRKKLSASVSAWSARSGTPHGVIHNKL